MKPIALTHQLIRASAGTGKTFQLTNRYLHLLSAGVPPYRILATTFTRKAAGEILERVASRLAEAALGAQDRDILRVQLGLSGLTEAGCQQMLGRLIGDLHRLQIATLDSFFGQLARGFALELGLPPRWEPLDEPAQDLLRQEAVSELLAAHDRDTLLNLLHLLAKGETQRSVCRLVGDTVDHLYATFLRSPAEAWQTLRPPARLSADRLKTALEELAALNIKDRRFVKARDNDLAQAEREDWEGFVSGGLAKRILQDQPQPTYYRKPIDEEVVAAYQPLIAQARAVVLSRVAAQTKATYELLSAYDVSYRVLKRARGRLEFDDVTREIGNLVANDWEWLAYRLDGMVDHLLLDEFQDTNPEQWQALLPFARRAASPGSRSFFCVGDVKQAIYGWRGGVAEIFERIEQELEGLDNTSLAQSRRSSPIVIETVNRIFTHVGQHQHLAQLEEAVQEWAGRFDHHTTALEKPGYAALETALGIEPGEASDARTIEGKSFDRAAQQVSELATEAAGISIGVLVRTNQAVGELMVRLRKLGIHASGEGGNPLNDAAGVELILSLLRLIDHPGDRVAQFHVGHSPLGSLLGIAADTPTPELHLVLQLWRSRLLRDGYGCVVAELSAALSPCCDRRELSRLEQLTDLAYTYSPTLRCVDFLREVERRRVLDPSAANVRVMTVHQSKGLEFDAVVLPQLDGKHSLSGKPPDLIFERSTPTGPASCVASYVNQDEQPLLPERLQQAVRDQQRRSVHESLCLLYVAITRAAQAVYMIIAANNKGKSELPRTFAGLLRAALTEGHPAPPDTLLYEHGDRDWYRQPGKVAAADEGAAQQLPASIRFQPEVAAVRAARPPSARDRRPPATVAEEYAGATQRIRDRGTLFHAWLERIVWLEDGSPSEQQLRQVAFTLAWSGEDLEQLVAEFTRLLQHGNNSQVLQRRAYQQATDLPFPTAVRQLVEAGSCQFDVYGERPFVLAEDGVTTRGSIDRMVVLCSAGRPIAADILDFKTDAELAGAADRHAHQLAVYRRAAMRISGLASDRIATRLVMFEHGEVVDVPPGS